MVATGSALDDLTEMLGWGPIPWACLEAMWQEVCLPCSKANVTRPRAHYTSKRVASTHSFRQLTPVGNGSYRGGSIDADTYSGMAAELPFGWWLKKSVRANCNCPNLMTVNKTDQASTRLAYRHTNTYPQASPTNKRKVCPECMCLRDHSKRESWQSTLQIDWVSWRVWLQSVIRLTVRTVPHKKPWNSNTGRWMRQKMDMLSACRHSTPVVTS
jgi:hypothetical protein